MLNPVERFTALISLLAYLIGGWLAPLLHTHSDGTSCHHQHAVAVQHQRDAENQCCSHDHAAHDAEVHRDVPETNGLLDHSNGSSASASEPTDRDEKLLASDAPTCGVCALCLARSSAKERHQDHLFSLTHDQQTQSVQTIDAIQQSNFSSCPLSRGPPPVV